MLYQLSYTPAAGAAPTPHVCLWQGVGKANVL